MGLTKFIEVQQNMISDMGGGGVRQFQFFSEKGGRRVRTISGFWLTRVGGGVWTPHFWLK